MPVSEGTTILVIIFSNLLGIMSRAVDFFSSSFLNRLKSTSRPGVFTRCMEGKTRDLLLKQEHLGLVLAQYLWLLIKSFMSPEVLIVLLSTWISKIFDDLLVLRELNPLMRFHVLRRLPLLASKLSEKLRFFACLIALFVWFLARLNCCHNDVSTHLHCLPGSWWICTNS